MRQPYFLLAALFLLFSTHLCAQNVLLFEDFNACALPAGWTVKATGNQNSAWSVGISTNDDAVGQSIDGTCFLLIDDDATGDDTPAYVIDFVSPPFDASKNSTIAMACDIHYRDWNEAKENFQVLVTDGITETVLSTFDSTRTNGEGIQNHFDFRYDLSLVTKSPNARLIFRYDDGGGFAWWAGVDNLSIVGSGVGSNVVAETFNNCKMPEGWTTEIVTGQQDWTFGTIDTTSDAYAGGNSMDGSCFVFFDDDKLGEFAPYSTARIATPWFDGTDHSRYTLHLDAILRYEKEQLAVIVEFANGESFLISQSTSNVGGPQFPQFIPIMLDLSNHRDAKMRVVFEYRDGNAWGWWAGIDNVKITGEGSINDKCTLATSLSTGATCLPGSNLLATFNGPPATCTARAEAGLWYRWTADFSGTARFESGAKFNDVVNVYTGGCQALQNAACNNRDEHGFGSEATYFTVQSGTEYLLRVSGQTGGFGIPRGDLCTKIESVPGFPPTPANDDCATAAALTVGQPCAIGNNRNAATSPTLPSLNERARADVWYTFTAPAVGASEKLVVENGSSFSDIITVYRGGCAALEEVSGNHHGGSLDLPALTAGETYWLQIAGNFATVEGRFCVEVTKVLNDLPANDNCVNALNIPIGGQCTAGNNATATFSGKMPPCAFPVDRDIWFKFVAPASGSVLLNTGADFEHSMAIWSGDCNTLSPFFCVKNPLRCAGYVFVGNLAVGQTYFLQIGAWSQAANPGTGQVCVKILSGNATPDFEPLTLDVKEVCNGVGTAKLVISTTGGVAPLTFEGGQNGQTLPSGTTYLSIVTDAMGCEQTHLGTVKVCLDNSCTLAASLTQQQPKCFGAADGSLTANVAGGAQPFQYKWSNGSTEAIATGLKAGTYTVTVIDALSCEFSSSATLISPAAIVAAASSLQNPTQGQSNGSILVDVAGGDGNFVFAWLLNGQPFSASEDLTNAPAGNYELVVTDGAGCKASFLFVLTATSSTDNPNATLFAEVFPNPARDKATLAVALPTAQTLYLSLVDATGRALQAWTVDQVTEQNIPLDLRSLPAGAYQLRILSGSGEQAAKAVVVEK